MSAEYSDDYTLGQEVTQMALGKKARETVVVSVRVSMEDFARLEKISIKAGKSISQVVREAVAKYCEPDKNLEPSATFRMDFKTSEGFGFAVGPVDYTSAVCSPQMVGIHAGNQASGRWWGTLEQPNPEEFVVDVAQQR